MGEVGQVSDDIAELELRISREYARRSDLALLEKAQASSSAQVTSKIEGIMDRLSSQQRTMELLEYRLSGIQGALNKIMWLILAPLITGAGYYLIQAVNSFTGQ